MNPLDALRRANRAQHRAMGLLRAIGRESPKSAATCAAAAAAVREAADFFLQAAQSLDASREAARAAVDRVIETQ